MEEKKKYPASSNEYKREWLEKNRERINLAVPKGFREVARAAADRAGKSLNSFALEAIQEKIEREENAPD